MNEMVSVPYVVYEQEKAHHDREKKRWFIICLVLILALIATNLAWVIYESQFEVVTETEVVEEYEYEIEQDAMKGNNNFVGHDGGIANGETTN